MATVAVNLIPPVRTLDQRGVYTVEWTPLTNVNVDGSPVANTRFSDRSVQVSGTFGAGGTITMQGTNQVDGAGLPINWATLFDQAGAALTFTAAGLKTVLQVSRFIRPLESAGDGTTSLTVTLTSHGDDV